MGFRASTSSVAFALVIAGCGASQHRFVLRDPITVDSDRAPFSAPCKPDPKDAGHMICAPHEYVSPFVLDGLDNMVLRPITRFFAVDPSGESLNVNSFDEVPDSTWFENRISRRWMSVEEFTRGPCTDADLDVDAEDGAWLIDQGKPNGANPGFRVKLPDGRKVLLKADEEGKPERATGATAIATRFYHGVGYNTVCDRVVYIRRPLLKLKPGLTYSDNTGVERAFDTKKLEKLLHAASRRGDRIRLVASSWLPGRPIGPFTYLGVRKDDPNDVIPHEDRRELRGQRLLAAWLGHFDSREQNSMDTWVSDDPKDPDASPGHIKHWIIDFNDCFGSEWQWDTMSRRINFSYYFDGGHIARDFITLGVVERPWDRVERSREGSIFGYFEAKEFDPEKWKPGYQNPAFLRMSEQDGAWMARIVARITPEHVAAVVDVGNFTEAQHREYLTSVLIERRRKILQRYLSKLSPLSDFEVRDHRVCAADLARRAGVAAPNGYGYSARIRVGADGPNAAAPVSFESNERVCVELPAVESSAAATDPSRYRVVTIWNQQAERPVKIHLYDLGGPSGLRLAGVER